MQKRRYQKGFYISKKHSKQKTKDRNSDVDTTKFQSVTTHTNSEISDSCDVLIMNNGTEIYAKILEINFDQIKYVGCNSKNRKRRVLYKDKVFMLKRSDGSDIVFETTVSDDNRNIKRYHKQKIEKPIHDDALKSVLYGLTGLVWLGSLQAVLLGTNVLSDIKSSSLNYKGKAIAVLGIFLGVIGLIFWLMILTILVRIFVITHF
ncbi:MAG: DUF4190 domain-containing protein [Bacteroidetes bacterium]|nr:DUF4190 domain-containing protein [Bacteroidota bacterium]